MLKKLGCPVTNFGEFKTRLKSMSKKTLAGIFVFYLVRDSILYLIIPAMVARGLVVP